MKLSAARFEELVAMALDGLPEWVRAHMDNVAVITAFWPTAEQLRAAPAGQTLLGLYEGVPLTRRGRGYSLVPPDRITLFQGPLERLARDEATLIALIRRTVVHEIAHHFGFTEGQLRALGY